MVSRNDVRIAAIAIALAKEYDAPWLKGNKTVTRDASGKFASGSGGGGSSMKPEESEAATPPDAGTSPKQKTLVEKFKKTAKKIEKFIETAANNVVTFFADTFSKFKDAAKGLKERLGKVNPVMASSAEKSVNEVFKSLYKEKVDPKEFKEKARKAIGELQKEYESQSKKMSSGKGLSEKEIAESTGRLIGMQTWLAAAMTAAYFPETGAEYVDQLKEQFGVDPSKPISPEKMQKLLIQHSIEGAKEMLKAGQSDDLQLTDEAVRVTLKGLEAGFDFLKEEGMAKNLEYFKELMEK